MRTRFPQQRPACVLHLTTVPTSLMFLRGQTRYMQAAGMQVIAASSPGEELERFGSEEGVAVHPVVMERKITPLRDLATLARLVVLFRLVRPDIVHAHTPKAGLLGMLAALLARVPRRIYHLRGLPLETAVGGQRVLLTMTERAACGAAHRVICVSPSLRAEAVRLQLAHRNKFKVLGAGSGNGVAADGRFSPERHSAQRAGVRARYGIPLDAVVVLFLGRIVRDKGVEDLAHAWRRVRDRHPGAYLLMVGPLEARDPVSPDVLAALAGDARVRLRGACWDSPPLYAAADLVILPSHREGFPNVPLEAAAMGLPVIASDATGCVDAVADGITGMTVPAGDVTALAAALEAYLSDENLRRVHGESGRERVLRDFRPEAVWARLLDVYRTFLRWRPAPNVLVPTSPRRDSLR